MHANSFGRLFRLTTYGESHGPGLGGIVDGCPAGLELSETDIQKALDDRRPGQDGRAGAASTLRSETDRVRLLSGLFNGRTTGAPIAFHVENQDQRSTDYEALADLFRPGHADLTLQAKYGVRDYRGGGRSSGRETVSRVAGGAIAQVFLASQGVKILACTQELGGHAASLTDVAGAAKRAFFCPDEASLIFWEQSLQRAREENDTLGGLVRVEIHGLPAGLGDPVFDKLDARLAYAFMGVGAVKGVAIGAGFAVSERRGSENNDAILPRDASGQDDLVEGGALSASGKENLSYCFASNNAGGILGGISNGAPVIVTAAIKPIASICQAQRTMNTRGEPCAITIGGRHDVSAIPRIVPVLKAMAALCAADFLLLQRCARV